MNDIGNQMGTFETLARTFLANNPQILDTLIFALYRVADELDSLKGARMITNGKYMQPYRFKQKMIERVMRKLGYSTSDIHDLCSQGRAEELLQEIDRMERVPLLGANSPSRRALPIAVGSSRSTISRFEDVTDVSRK